MEINCVGVSVGRCAGRSYLCRGLALSPGAPGQRGPGLGAHHAVVVAVVTEAAVLVAAVRVGSHVG